MLSKVFTSVLALAATSEAVKLDCPCDNEGGCTITYYFPPDEPCYPFRNYENDSEIE